jgi:DTW domain-containing protein YfiP
VCLRCRRAAAACYCDHLAPTLSRVRVVFLQHPRERRVAIGTARMAHLALPNSELHVGVDFDDHPRVRSLAAAPAGRTVVLFPSPDAVEPEGLPDGAPDTLLVIDGTWIQARKMLERNAVLRTVPRIGFVPRVPGRYRIRREPAEHCRSTVEAVVEVLGRIEQDPERYRPLLGAFDQMVEAQLVYKEARPNPYHRTPRRRRARAEPECDLLRARWQDLVVVHGESNAYPRGSDVPGRSELVQLVAERPASGERFAAVIAPRRPLAPATPTHLEISAAELLAGEPVAGALARWRAFVRPDDVLCTWGSYAADLLGAEGEAAREGVDLRVAMARRLCRSAGGVEAAVRELGVEELPPAWIGGRAGRRIAALVEVVRRLSARAPGGERRAAPRSRGAR